MLVGRNPVSAAVIVKVDALDDPAIFEGSQMTFERLPD